MQSNAVSKYDRIFDPIFIKISPNPAQNTVARRLII